MQSMGMSNLFTIDLPISPKKKPNEIARDCFSWFLLIFYVIFIWF